MNSLFKIELVREKSFDPFFEIKVSYNDGTIRFDNELVKVCRRPPQVAFTYPPHIEPLLERVDQDKLELEIMNRIVEHLLTSAERGSLTLKPQKKA